MVWGGLPPHAHWLRGCRVILFEKNEWLGGKAAVLRRDRFRFDMVPTTPALPSVLRRI